MYLRNIACKSFKLNTFINSKEFNLASECMESLYLGELVKYDTGKFAKVNIVLHEKLLKKHEYPKIPLKDLTKEQRQERMKNNEYYHTNQIEKQIDVVSIHRSFDFAAWNKETKKDKKELILNEIHASMLFLSKELLWNTTPLENVFDTCAASGFENNWIIKKLKIKSSPNRKYKAGIYAEFDIDEFRFFAVVYDKLGNLIKKESIYIEKGRNFVNNAFSIINGKTKWKGNDFSLTDENNELLGEISISDSIAHRIVNS